MCKTQTIVKTYVFARMFCSCRFWPSSHPPKTLKNCACLCYFVESSKKHRVLRLLRGIQTSLAPSRRGPVGSSFLDYGSYFLYYRSNVLYYGSKLLYCGCGCGRGCGCGCSQEDFRGGKVTTNNPTRSPRQIEEQIKFHRSPYLFIYLCIYLSIY